MRVRPGGGGVGGSESVREWFCSSVSCLLLVGPMQELDPHLHPAEAQREEQGCHELSQDSGRAGKDQSGTAGQPGTVKLTCMSPSGELWI